MKNEKNILMMCDSNFIIKLYSTNNSDQTLEFLLEPALGGELYTVYRRKMLSGSAPHAKYYSGSCIYAFEHLHERRVIYRDLKPENILLNEHGHFKLTDMGLAKVSIGKTFTTCGTPDYFAPELIQQVGHTHAVDWWTLGILVYELMVGFPPFEDRSGQPVKTYKAIIAGIENVKFPNEMGGKCKNLIIRLLNADPAQRPPMLQGGADNLRNHPWYEGFRWDELVGKKMMPPYRPKVKDKKDIKNFEKTNDRPPMVKYVDDGTGWDKDF